MKNLKLFKYFSFAILFIASFTSSAQSGSEEDILQDSIKIARYTDSITTFLNSYQETCYTPKFDVATINYASETIAYLKFKESFGNEIEVIDSENNKRVWYIEGNETLIDHLAPNKIFLVEGTNSCGDRVNIGTIDTHKSGEVINVPDDIYNEIKGFELDGGGPKVYDIVKNMPNVNTWFKISIMQDFYLQGKPLPDEIRGEIPEREVLASSGHECNCGLFLSTGNDKIAPANVQNNTINPVVVINSNNSFGKRGKVFDIRSTHGPAKYAEIIQESVREKAGTVWSHDNSIEKDVIYASLSFYLRCEKIEGPTPPECACERGVYINYNYDNELRADAEANSVLYNSSASALVLETVALTMANEKTGDVQILDAKSMNAAAACSSTFNVDLAKEAAAIGVKLLDATKEVSGCAAFPPPFNGFCMAIAAYYKGQKLDGIKQDIINLIGTPIFLPADCTSQTKTGNMSGVKFIKIKAGEPSQISLTTSAALRMTGKRTWRSTGRILSNYSLAGVVSSGVVPDKPHCCTRAIGVWNLASVPDAPLTIANLRNNVGSWLSSHSSSWDQSVAPVNTNIGKALGTDVCGKDQIATNRSIFLSDIVYPENSEQISDYQIFDITGRLVHKSKAVLSYYDIQYNLYMKGYQPGMYIVLGKNKNGIQISKKFALN